MGDIGNGLMGPESDSENSGPSTWIVISGLEAGSVGGA